jgi:hypothetical protein
MILRGESDRVGTITVKRETLLVPKRKQCVHTRRETWTLCGERGLEYYLTSIQHTALGPRGSSPEERGLMHTDTAWHHVWTPTEGVSQDDSVWSSRAC